LKSPKIWIRWLFVLLALLCTITQSAIADDQSTSTPFAPAPSFFPARPAHAELHYRTGVLIAFGLGMHSGGAAIRDASGRDFSFFTGRPIFIDGKQTHCAIPPTARIQFDPTFCEGGWPADIIIGLTRVRIYYWHDVTPWGQHVEVTDQIIKAP
jgi:hypothetical protein